MTSERNKSDDFDKISYAESESEAFLDSTTPLDGLRRNKLQRSVSRTYILTVKDEECQADTEPLLIEKEIRTYINDPSVVQNLELLRQCVIASRLSIVEEMKQLHCCWSFCIIFVILVALVGMYMLQKFVT
jgi:hypothetical protein